MKFLISMVPVAILSLLAAGQISAQMATEQFIPIGESPGLSVIHTDIGHIQAFDAASGTLSVESGGSIRPVHITDATRIWLDRSASKLSNLDGDTSDLAAGRRVEVSYVDPESRQAANWVKVEAGN